MFSNPISNDIGVLLTRDVPLQIMDSVILFTAGSGSGGGNSGGTVATTTTTASQPTSTGGGSTNCAAMWGQCGGSGFTGPTCCAQGTCTYSNQWYSQCL